MRQTKKRLKIREKTKIETILIENFENLITDLKQKNSSNLYDKLSDFFEVIFVKIENMRLELIEACIVGRSTQAFMISTAPSQL